MGTICGVIIFSLILGLLIFWGISSFYQDAVKGLVLIVALAINVLERLRQSKSL